MSDFSLLYKKYNSVSNLTSDLNNSVITLKRKTISKNKEYTEKHPRIAVTDEQVAKANQLLVDILSLLEKFYSNQDTRNELYELMDNTLFQNQILKSVVFKDHIIKVLEKLKEKEDLTAGDLSSVDKFISVLDNEASMLFRKLRTSRG
ncbi:MAG: hypothetical protein JNJ75_10545 [Cyclobacteriaceae bacterium]|nr:hypothetical protein [Cyclobacteriaceae bacterium]